MHCLGAHKTKRSLHSLISGDVWAVPQHPYPTAHLVVLRQPLPPFAKVLLVVASEQPQAAAQRGDGGGAVAHGAPRCPRFASIHTCGHGGRLCRPVYALGGHTCRLDAVREADARDASASQSMEAAACRSSVASADGALQDPPGSAQRQRSST